MLLTWLKNRRKPAPNAGYYHISGFLPGCGFSELKGHQMTAVIIDRLSSLYCSWWYKRPKLLKLLWGFCWGIISQTLCRHSYIQNRSQILDILPFWSNFGQQSKKSESMRLYYGVHSHLIVSSAQLLTATFHPQFSLHTSSLLTWKGVGLMTYTTTSHQGASEMFWLPFVYQNLNIYLYFCRSAGGMWALALQKCKCFVQVFTWLWNISLSSEEIFWFIVTVMSYRTVCSPSQRISSKVKSFHTREPYSQHLKQPLTF